MDASELGSSEPDQRPAAAGVEPFLSKVDDAIRFQPLNRPIGRFFVLRGAGWPRTIAIGEPEERVHHLRPLQPLGTNPRNRDAVDSLDSLPRKSGHGEEQPAEDPEEGTLHVCH